VGPPGWVGRRPPRRCPHPLTDVVAGIPRRPLVESRGPPRIFVLRDGAPGGSTGTGVGTGLGGSTDGGASSGSAASSGSGATTGSGASTGLGTGTGATGGDGSDTSGAGASSPGSSGSGGAGPATGGSSQGGTSSAEELRAAPPVRQGASTGTGGRAPSSSDPTTFGLNGPSKCAAGNFAICEDFESTAVGAIPTGWTKEGTWATVVTADDKARGSHSLQISVGDANNARGFLNKTAAQLGPLASKAAHQIRPHR
jgi:hypothetical protein